MAGTLKAKDPATGEWRLIQSAGPKGPAGPTGPPGPAGVTGPSGTPADEVHIGPALDQAAKPNIDLWYDTDMDDSALREIHLPPGNTVNTALVKASDVDRDVAWRGPHLPLSGGTISGSLTAASTMKVNGTLTAPTVNGGVHFNHNIEAERVEDRTAYGWQDCGIVNYLHNPWETWNGEHGDTTADYGRSLLFRNRYNIVMSLCIRRTYAFDENIWIPVFLYSLLPDWCPPHNMYSTRVMIQSQDTGPPYEVMLEKTGGLWVYVKGQGTAAWDEGDAFSINFCYPRTK